MSSKSESKNSSGKEIVAQDGLGLVTRFRIDIEHAVRPDKYYTSLQEVLNAIGGLTAKSNIEPSQIEIVTKTMSGVAIESFEDIAANQGVFHLRIKTKPTPFDVWVTTTVVTDGA
jgi:hypothetical protein